MRKDDNSPEAPGDGAVEVVNVEALVRELDALLGAHFSDDSGRSLDEALLAMFGQDAL